MDIDDPHRTLAFIPSHNSLATMLFGPQAATIPDERIIDPIETREIIKTMMLLLCLPMVALAADVPTVECHNAAIIGFMVGYPAGMKNPYKPETGCYYELKGTTPFQKTSKGYLIGPLPGLSMGEYSPSFVWLETTEDFPQEAMIQGRATYVGMHSYQAINGFAETVYGFTQIKEIRK